MQLNEKEIQRIINNTDARLGEELAGVRVILASKSPRRRQLIAALVRDFEVMSAEADESLPEGMHPSLGVEVLAVRKGRAVADIVGENALIVSSDTLMELDGEPLGKPGSREDALGMLCRMQGREHHVHTGIAVHYRGRVLSAVESAVVRFREASEDELWQYVLGGEPMDKAGAYGIQGEGGKFVLGYEGGFDTIMGLSVELCEKLIRKALMEVIE